MANTKMAEKIAPSQIVTVALNIGEISQIQKKYDSSQIITIPSVNDYLRQLNDLGEVQVLIVSSFLPEKEIQVLSSLMGEKRRVIPLLVLRDFGIPTPERKTQTNLKLIAEEEYPEVFSPAENESEFYGVPISHFYNFDQIFCDLYIRIRKVGQKDQFLKRINAHDKIDLELIERLAKMGVKYLYVPQEYKNNLTVLLMNKTNLTLKSVKSTEISKVSTNTTFHQFINESMLKAQFGDLIVEMAKTSVQAMYDTVKKNPSLRGLEVLLEQASTTLNYKVNCISTIVIHKILQQLSWATTEHRVKLTYACFFSDLFAEEESFRKAHLKSDVNSSQWQVETGIHAARAAEIVLKYEGLPFGFELLIREHHGDKRGVQIKSEPDADISPLSRILLVSNEFALMYLEGPAKGNPLRILRSLEQKYQGVEMQKLFGILKDTLRHL